MSIPIRTINIGSYIVTDLTRISWSNDGQSILYNIGSIIFRYLITTNKIDQYIPFSSPPGNHPNAISSYQLSPNNQNHIACGYQWSGLIIYNINKQKIIFDSYSLTNLEEVYQIEWSKNGQYIAAGGKRGNKPIIIVFDVGLNRIVAEYTRHQGVISSISWNNDNNTIVSSSKNDKTIRIWKIQDTEYKKYERNPLLLIIKCPSKEVMFNITIQSKANIVLWHPNNKNIISCEYNTKNISIWNGESGALVHSFESINPITSILLNLNGDKIIAATNNGIIEQFNFAINNNSINPTAKL